MKKDIDVIKKSPLFRGVKDENILDMLQCFQGINAIYERNSFILEAGETNSKMGLLLTGKVYIIKEDFWGNRNIIIEILPGDIFGEVYGIIKDEPLGNSVMAAEKSQVLFLEIEKLMTMCTESCRFHNLIIKNLLNVMAEKTLLMTQKMEHMSKRTIRDKLISYLSEQSIKNGNQEFEIPFGRQQLADYLAIDRSSMSRELCNMKKEGLLEFYKNRFILYNENV